MLKYELNKQTFDNDTLDINYSGAELTTYEEDPYNLMWVTLLCDNIDDVQPGDKLSIVSNFLYNNDISQVMQYASDSANIEIESVDKIGNTITFVDSKYKELKVDSIIAFVDDNNITIWEFNFDAHYFLSSDTISLNIVYNDIPIVIDNIEYVDFQRLIWTFDATVDNIADLSRTLFGTISPDNETEAKLDNIIVKRDQIRWNIVSQSNPRVSIAKYKVKLNVPIIMKSKVDLYREENIKEYFVHYENEKAINTPIEMEKFAYTPVVVSSINNGNPTFEDCTKINFNLHFRVHDGNDWTVNDSDSWNFDKYDHHNDPTANKYYSYAQNAAMNDAPGQWKRSCQSDLLTYVGFITNDVKYQKNKLKKSFIRLSFYDSNDPGQQSLLAYSTIFIDCNKLYSKFISRMNFNCYYNSDGDIVKGIKVDREVNTLIPPDSLASVLSIRAPKPEEIEENRLSAQISVKNRFTSNNSSEGFYLYTWELSDIPTMPADVYMKVEFNHAGYGRNIPMMAPYRDNPNNRGFKTNAEIVSDWTGENTGYGIKKYTRYSYIHFKAKYDANTKRHIYYLDPDTYGTKYEWDKNILNINLYEARIAFD